MQFICGRNAPKGSKFGVCEPESILYEYANFGKHPQHCKPHPLGFPCYAAPACMACIYIFAVAVGVNHFELASYITYSYLAQSLILQSLSVSLNEDAVLCQYNSPRHDRRHD